MAGNVTLASTQYDSTTLGLGTQVGISASITIYCLLQFEWNRRKKSMQYLYTPRTKLVRNPSPPIPSGLFSWIRATICLSDEFYLKNAGLDALMYIRFLKMAFQFVLFNVIVVGAILIPINYTGGGIVLYKDKEFVPKMSLSNIDPQNKNILWAHVICTYIVSISWMYLSYKNYYEYMVLNREYLINRILDGSITGRTVMISRLPHDLRSEEALHKYVSNLGLGEVESARLVRFTGKLDRKISRREKALLSLEKAHIKLAENICNAIKRRKLFGNGIWARLFGYTNDFNFNPEDGEAKEQHQKVQNLVDWLDPRKRRRMESTSERNVNVTNHPNHPTTGTFSSDDLMSREDGYGRQFLIWNSLRHISKDVLDKYQPTHREGFFGKKVVSIDSYLKSFNSLDRRIAELRSKSTQETPYKATSTGFVTFKDHISAQLCAQSVMNSKPHTCTTKMAPEPRDILWDNLTKKFKEKLFRSTIVNICVWALTIFWVFPIVALLTLTSIEQLVQKLSFLEPFLNTPTVIKNVLPTVMVSFFMAILPWILMELSKQEGFPSYSELEEAVLIRYYHFSFFNVFVVFLLGYAFLQSIVLVIQNPTATSILEIFAINFPRGSTFFVYYVIFNTCTHGLELIQVGSQLFLHIILTTRFIATTPRMLQRVTHPWCFQFYYYYPNHILIFVITLTYSVINPLILVVALIYFGIALVVFKHQFAYCYVRRYEAGGKFYRHVFRYTTDGLIVFQLIMISAIWVLRQATQHGAVLLPILIATGYFKYYCHKTFYSRTHFLALDSRNDVQNAQNAQNVQNNTENTAERERSANLSKSHTEEENDESEMRIKEEVTSSNKNITNSKEDGYSNELVENNDSINSDTSTKIASTKNNGFTKDTVENDINNRKNEENINDKQSSEKIRFSIEKPSSWLQKSSSLTQPEQNEENNNSSETNDSVTILIKGSTDDNVASSSKAQKKIKGNNKLTIIPPERINNLLDKPFTNSPTESFRRHAMRLPSAANLRRLHPAHFTHDPNYKVLQDETSQFQTYTHPNLIKALNRKLWLPRNPLKKICLEHNIEMSKALTSSRARNDIVGYWGDNSQYLREAVVSAYGDHEFPSHQIEDTIEDNEDHGKESALSELHIPISENVVSSHVNSEYSSGEEF